jgi:hypothetical protein
VAQLPKGEIELALSRVCCQTPEDGGGFDPAGSNRDRHPQHLRQHGFDQVPIDRLREKTIDVVVAKVRPGAIEMKPLPVANPRLELNAEQMRESKDGRALSLRVGVDRVRPHIRVVFDKIVQDVVALPGAAGREPREESDVHVRDHVVADPAVPVTDDRGRILGEARTDSGTFASLLVDVPLRHDKTVFDRFGTWFPWMAGLLLLSAVVKLFTVSRVASR